MNVKTKKIIFSSIFLIGMLIAITAGAKLPEHQGGFPNSLPAFFIGSIISLFGLIFWRRAVREELKAEAFDENQTEGNPIHYLKSVIPLLENLNTKISTLNEEETCKEIDIILDNYVLPMAEVREKMTNLFGMSKGSNILVTVAFGERMLNRVWSAASDGHLTEARKSFPDALHAFKEAHSML